MLLAQLLAIQASTCLNEILPHSQNQPPPGEPARITSKSIGALIAKDHCPIDFSPGFWRSLFQSIDEFRDLPASPAFPIDCEYRVNNLERFLNRYGWSRYISDYRGEKIIIRVRHDILKFRDNFWNVAHLLVNNLRF